MKNSIKLLVMIIGMALCMTTVQAQTDQEKLQSLMREMQKLESQRTLKTQQKKWTATDETAYKKKSTDLNTKVKALQTKINNSTPQPSADQQELDSKKREISLMENKREMSKQANRWTAANETAHQKAVADLKARIKDLEAKLKK